MNSPSTLQAVILGLCLGAIYGLFFYQRYRSQYFWLISAGAGIVGAVIGNLAIRSMQLWDSQFMLAAILQIAIPSLIVLLCNRQLATQRKKRRREIDSQLLSSPTLTSFL